MTQDQTPTTSAVHDTHRTAAGAPEPPHPGDPFPGEFRIVRRLGYGAFGDVWLADDLSPLRRSVALKFLRTDTSRGELALATLKNEAGLLAAFRHPNIVQVHAWRSVPATGRACLVMQYVAGDSLEKRVNKSGSLPWAVACRYIADVADGLTQVHARQLIHRDIKPANMLHDPAGDEALLTDFGIAAALGGPTAIAGTGLYMAPEAFAGAAGAAADVYGLAVSLFWLVTATHPFGGRSRAELQDNIRRGLDPLDGRFAGLPRPIELLIRAGLHAAAGQRPSLAAFAAELRGALNLLMADSLAPAGGRPPVDLRLRVLLDSAGGAAPVAGGSATGGVLRDLKRVPPAPPRVTLHTGDRIRIEVVADQPGHVTVFNVGPSGNVNLLWPHEPGQAPPLLPAHQVLPILAVELTPPAGTERLFALWTRRPLPLRLDELRSLASGGAYRATRDMARVQQSLQQLPLDDRHAVVLELDHQ